METLIGIPDQITINFKEHWGKVYFPDCDTAERIEEDEARELVSTHGLTLANSNSTFEIYTINGDIQ